MKDRLYNLDVLKATTDGDNEFFIKILSTFLANNKDSLSKMQEAVKTKKTEDVGNFAHKMLSSYKHLEVHLLTDVLARLEGLSLGLGQELSLKEVEGMVAYLSVHSVELFGEIEKEIEKVAV